MFVVNEDNSIYATRGDIVFFSVTAEDKGVKYTFKAGDVLRIKVYGKKNAEDVVLQKDFPVTEDTEMVEIFLSEEDTKIGDVISKPKDYWYEVELNPLNNPQTIIGYDEDGARVFKLFPEGDDIPDYVPNPEDFAVMDDELDMTSTRPVQNQAIARAVVSIKALAEETAEGLAIEKARFDNLISQDDVTVAPSGAGTVTMTYKLGDYELKDIRVGADGTVYGNAGTAVREQFKNVYEDFRSINRFNKDDSTNLDGYYVKSDGSLEEQKYYLVTHFIPAKVNDVINISDGFELEYYGGCMYDSSKNPLGRIQFTDKKYTITNGRCCYVKLNVLKDDLAIAMACINNEVPAEYEAYFFRRKLHNIIEFSENQKAFMNPLYGKVVSFNGDSICYGEGHRGGYGLMIATENNMIYENRGISGGTITAETYFDTEKKRPKHWICRDIENMRDDADYIILEGGVNDKNSENIGAITKGFRASLNDTTFCGAFESMLKKAILKWPGKKIGYILSPKAYDYDGTGADKEKWDCARAICEKWSVPYLDLRNESGLNAGLTETRALFFHNSDGVHPNERGYKVIVPKIVAWMKTL